MGVVKGAGPCPIPRENGLPCGRQIGEGEPRGTITQGNAFNPQSQSGHKHCADAWWERKRAVERERNTAMVQRINQRPDGAVNPSDAFDPVQGSVSLDKDDTKEPTRPQIVGDMSQGAHFIGDLPEDAAPEDAVKYAKGEPIKVVKEDAPGLQKAADFVSGLAGEEPYQRRSSQPILTAQQSYARGILGDPLPKVDAQAARVVLAELHVRPDGTLHLDPEDAEDLIALLGVNVNRARRQQL